MTAVPANQQVVQVASPAEFEAAIDRFEAASKPVTVDYRLPRAFGLPRYGTQGTPAFSTLTRDCTRPFTPATFYTMADIRVAVDGTFRWIDRVQNTRTGLSGIVATAQLSNAYSYIRSQTATRVEITGGGTVSAYFQVGWGVVRLVKATDLTPDVRGLWLLVVLLIPLLGAIGFLARHRPPLHRPESESAEYRMIRPDGRTQ